MQRRHLWALAAAGAWPAVVWADAAPAEVERTWPQARLVGRGRLRFMGLRIYEARLWAPGRIGADDWSAQPFALELAYARALDGAAMAERSLAEMRRQRDIDPVQAERWLALMKASFPDVREGDRLTGLHRPEEGARIYFNGELRQQWPEAALARQFFGIWLAPQASVPSLREALLGGGA
jgi:hypothetical protein